jgi:AcrR family transcriptional regulator
VPARLPAARRRRQLLDVALTQFATQGYHQASMDDIAEAAGVTKPVLYQHFGSKRALYLELLEDVGSALLEAIAKATAEAASPHQQVEAGFAAYFGFVDEHRHAFRLLFSEDARRDAVLAEAVVRVERAIAEAVANLIEADLDDDHRRILAYGIVGLAEGTCRHWLAHDLDLEPGATARWLADLAWAGLRGVRRI